MQMAMFDLGRLFRRGTPQEQERDRERRQNKRNYPKPGSKVLVVDDSRTVRYSVRKMLEEGRFEVVEAENGQQAVELAIREKPCLIIMDIVMPGVNGFQATRRIRRNPQTASIPIVIMSGDKEATHQFWGTRIGANEFMSKPFVRFDLYSRVERILFDNEISRPADVG